MHRKFFYRVLSAFVFLGLSQAQAAGWTNSAVPTGFDLVTVSSPGIMVYGAFGNANNCTIANQFFIPKAGNESNYAELVAALMTANATGKKVQVYITSCTQHAWYSSPDTTFNQFLGHHLSFRD